MDKNKTVIILAAVVLLFFVFNIGSCVNAYNQNSARKKEMFQRLDLEEKMAAAVKENAGAAEKIKDLQKQLDQAAGDLEEMKKSLTQEQLINASLKDDLGKLTKSKDALEEELKKAAASAKKAKR